jgi:Raf kinase inhibitor-like YbhB/YbcL family protein
MPHNGYSRHMSGRRITCAVLLGICGIIVGCAAAPAGGGASAPPTPSTPTGAAAFAVASPAFTDGSPMPVEHAMPGAGGRNVSVPLTWSSPPAGTRSFAIEVVDLSPVANSWVHWLVVDIPADAAGLAAGASGTAMPGGCRELVNGFGARGWGGPQPPPGTGRHDYRITVYALDAPALGVADTISLDAFRTAVAGRTLASAGLTGTFQQ